MYSLFVEQKFLRYVVALLLLIYSTNLSAVAQEDEDNPVSNVRVSKQGRVNVFVEYDLAGSEDDVYTVSLTVKMKSDSTYSYSPVNVIGDIGTNIRPGKNKRISWRMSDEYNPAFDKSDVEYVVTAVPRETEGTGTGLYIAGGAAVVGLALAVILLSSNKSDQQQVNNAFPLPPGRPR